MINAVSDRFELIVVPRRCGVPSFAEDVRAGLTASPKRLPSKYLYDEIGSALFDAITRLPEYYLTRAETEILAQCGWQIVRLLDGPIDFVELGSGSAAKTRLLIEEALRVQGELRYSPDRHLDPSDSRIVVGLGRRASRIGDSGIRGRLFRRLAIASAAVSAPRSRNVHGFEHR